MYEYVSAVVRHAVFESDSDGSTFASVTLLSPIEVQGKDHKESAALLKIKVHNVVIAALKTHKTLPVIDGIEPPAL